MDWGVISFANGSVTLHQATLPKEIVPRGKSVKEEQMEDKEWCKEILW